MRLAIIAVTRQGAFLAQDISRKLTDKETAVYLPAALRDSGSPAEYFDEALGALIKRIWTAYDGIICVMAMGIVVRVIAPLIKDKREDPAVVVLDEKGTFAISTLSGHLGGANALTEKVARTIGAQPVITTATDVNNLPAIEMAAKKNNLVIENYQLVKKVNAALVNGEEFTIYSRDTLGTKWPGGVQFKDPEDFLPEDSRLQVLVSNKQRPLANNTLVLRPRNLIVGIGCRRGIDNAKIIAAVNTALEEAGLSVNSIKAMASVDIKRDEQGLIEAAESFKVPLHFFSREEINRLYSSETGKQLSYSDYVQEKLGVGGVCEAVTLLTSREAKLVFPKRKMEGVTVAIAEENWPL